MPVDLSNISFHWNVTRTIKVPEMTIDIEGEPTVFNNVVTKIWFVLTVLDTNGRYAADFSKSLDLPLPTDPLTYIPFDQLTTETMIAWVQTHLGETQILAFQQEIQHTLENYVDIPVIAVPMVLDDID